MSGTPGVPLAVNCGALMEVAEESPCENNRTLCSLVPAETRVFCKEPAHKHQAMPSSHCLFSTIQRLLDAGLMPPQDGLPLPGCRAQTLQVQTPALPVTRCKTLGGFHDSLCLCHLWRMGIIKGSEVAHIPNPDTQGAETREP